MNRIFQNQICILMFYEPVPITKKFFFLLLLETYPPQYSIIESFIVSRSAKEYHPLRPTLCTTERVTLATYLDNSSEFFDDILPSIDHFVSFRHFGLEAEQVDLPSPCLKETDNSRTEGKNSCKSKEFK
jgi:hypothetical protein